MKMTDQDRQTCLKILNIKKHKHSKLGFTDQDKIKKTESPRYKGTRKTKRFFFHRKDRGKNSNSQTKIKAEI